jgi:hypothetical protein
MRKGIFIFSILLFGSQILFGAEMNIDKKASFESSFRVPVWWGLFHWPDEVTLRGEKVVDPSAQIVRYPKKRSWEWMEMVLNKSWLPPENTPMYCIKEEFDGRDVTRITWSYREYRIEVSQTGSIFALKILAQVSDKFGRESSQRLEAARELCRQCFNTEGRMWSRTGYPVVVIPELNEKIVNFSFDSAKMKQVDKVVFGQPKSMEDEGVKLPTLPPGGGPVELTPDLNSPGGWWYWFRNVNWWNDGQAVGFYFLKKDGPGPRILSFSRRNDQNWFDVPRDRLGRPISF